MRRQANRNTRSKEEGSRTAHQDPTESCFACRNPRFQAKSTRRWQQFPSSFYTQTRDGIVTSTLKKLLGRARARVSELSRSNERTRGSIHVDEASEKPGVQRIKWPTPTSAPDFLSQHQTQFPTCPASLDVRDLSCNHKVTSAGLRVHVHKLTCLCEPTLILKRRTHWIHNLSTWNKMSEVHCKQDHYHKAQMFRFLLHNNVREHFVQSLQLRCKITRRISILQR